MNFPFKAFSVDREGPAAAGLHGPGNSGFRPSDFENCGRGPYKGAKNIC